MGTQATIHNMWTEITRPQFCAKALVRGSYVSVTEWSTANLVAAARIDTGDFVMGLREWRSPRMSSKTPASASWQSTAAPAPTLATTSRIRNRIEEVFGWAKTVAGSRKMGHCELPKVDGLEENGEPVMRRAPYMTLEAIARSERRSVRHARRKGPHKTVQSPWRARHQRYSYATPVETISTL